MSAATFTQFQAKRQALILENGKNIQPWSLAMSLFKVDWQCAENSTKNLSNFSARHIT